MFELVSADTPLRSLPMLCLDLETTGLNVALDRIVQIGAYNMFGPQRSAKPALDLLVNPGVPIPSRATHIHGISDAEVAGAVTFLDCVAQLQQALVGRAVVGHHIGFDLAILRFEAARIGVCWNEPNCLDLALLVAALEPGLPDHSMETVASWLGVDVMNRHSALGDCQAVVDMFAKLLPLLEKQGITTLGQAMSVLDSRDDLIRQERRAGWHSDPKTGYGLRQLQIQQELEHLRHTKQAQAEEANQQLSNGAHALDIQTRISSTNQQLHRCVIDLCINEALANGDGEPPVEFDAIIIGSGARMESLLYPDQDNGFILGNLGNQSRVLVGQWFEDLAQTMCDALAVVGFYHCPGWVMASNPRWRKPYDDFQEQVVHWIKTARGDALHYCNIFLDFDNFYGKGDLTRSLRNVVFREASNQRFLTRLYDIHKDDTGAINWLGRIVTSPNPDANKGKINLKVGGMLPIVTAVRLLALHTGIRGQSTGVRIRKLAESNFLDEAEELLSAYEFCVYLLLRQQIEDHKLTRTLGNYIPPESLKPSEKARLAKELKVVRKFCKRVGKVIRRDIPTSIP